MNGSVRNRQTLSGAKRQFVLLGLLSATFILPFLIIKLSVQYPWLAGGETGIILFIALGLFSLEYASIGQIGYGVWVGLPQTRWEKIVFIVLLFALLFFASIFFEFNSVRHKIPSGIFDLSFYLTELTALGFLAFSYYRLQRKARLQKSRDHEN